MARRMKRFGSEDDLHLQVAEYLRRQYPKVIFRTDFAAGIKMTPGQATKHKRLQSGKSYPDLFIAEPRSNGQLGSFGGCYIELKAEDAVLYRKDGTLSQSEHIQAQAEVLIQLAAKGYKADFAQGFDDAKKKIDDYLGGIKPKEVVF